MLYCSKGQREMMKIAFNTQSTVSASALGRTGSRVPAKKSHIARN
jgi:hypothetical protein